MAPDPMTHEVSVRFHYGSMTFNAALMFYGDGDLEEFFSEELERAFPNAECVTITRLEI